MDLPSTERQTSLSMLRRVAIEALDPEVDGGRFPIKRVIGEQVVVSADIHADGHDELAALVLYRPACESAWHEAAMRLIENDRWQGEFRIETFQTFFYTVQAWVDTFRSWSRDLKKKVGTGQNVSVDVLAGAQLAEAAAKRGRGSDAQRLAEFAAELKHLAPGNSARAVELAQSPELISLMDRYPDRDAATTYGKNLRVVVDREKACFSSWYEMFPRSCTNDPSRHGTFRDCIRRLDYIGGMGFDVLYLPPIHPIGHTARKGANNLPGAFPKDPGSPWAIGSEGGGFKAIHPQLGSLADFRELQAKAAELGIEIALDLAFQCSPDHPYVREHEEWFRHRADGSIQYAENPPKKYEDIYPLNFGSDHALDLWKELKSVVVYWIEQGIRIFRVDNPHTKPYVFWEWLISEIKKEHPDVLFLAEAFTRPKVMYRLAKAGFSQSYTYFAWKNLKWELTQYFTELANPPVRDFFRANLWPNTPDILTEFLQHGGRPAFFARLVLAATLGASYGIYGPAFELCENRAVRQGSEEYLDSEKYQIRAWNLDQPGSLKDSIARVNSIRRENRALQSDRSLSFHPVDNDQLIAYSKMTENAADIILVVVNLDVFHKQSGWIEVPLADFRLDPNESFQVHDLLTDARYIWRGSRNYVELNPSNIQAHIFKVRRHARKEHDFDYYL